MNLRRARRFVGAACLVLVGGCAALSGLGDLEVVDSSEAGVQTSSGVDGSPAHRDGTVEGTSSGETSSSGDTGASSGQPDTGSSGQPDTGSSGNPDTGSSSGNPDTGAPDTSHPFDSGSVPDASQPDTGGPGTGPGGPGVVQCSAQVACSGQQPVCCFNAFAPFPSCTKSDDPCPIGEGFACDDDSDCAGTTSICCVTWTAASYQATSKCAASCTSSAGTFGEKKGRACAGSDGCTASQTCRNVPSAPTPIRACQ